MNDAFLKRFQSVRTHKQRTLMGEALARTGLCVLLGLVLAVAADYWWELDRSLRQASLAAAGLITVAYGLRAIVQTARGWGTPKTAAEIEESFPELGQSVRTSVQFGKMSATQVQAEGIASTLVTALVEETHRRALPLTIEDVIPTHKLWLTTGSLIAGAVLWGALSGANWEWRTATARTLFGERSYRELRVEPGNLTVDEGGHVELSATLVGRTNRTVTMFTRIAGQPESEWTERILTEQDQTASSAESAQVSGRPREYFQVQLERLTKPVEYYVRAGELESPIYRIRIRRPLRIEGMEVDLAPPSYTGQPTNTVRDGNLVALEGTQARFHVTFDKAIKSASMVLAVRKSADNDDAVPEPQMIPLVSISTPEAETPSPEAQLLGDDRPVTVTAELSLVEDASYSVVAEAVDGTSLPNNKYRIRIRQDQPPQVFFESPDDQVEVHSLAELPMRVRIRDDYGVARAGILFQINNEQEVPLVNEDFAVVAQAATEAATTGSLSPTTQAALEKVLPLEVFELTQKDSVMYYAFAEDNRPDRPQRTETELRFIDIRPFKRQYRVVDPDPMPANGMGGGNLKSLEELIQRQRYAVNRTIQIEKRAKVGRNPDASELDQLMKFETDLAQSVRETAQGLEARGFDDTELFYQAETAMLQAVDSLSVGNWENATQQMKDALKFLIEQRDRTIRAILKNPDPALLARLRQFDREQSQKLRRPKSDKEEARELIRRLEELIRQEGMVSEGLLEETASSDSAPANSSTSP